MFINNLSLNGTLINGENSSTENKDIALKNFKKLQHAYELIKKDKNI